MKIEFTKDFKKDFDRLFSGGLYYHCLRVRDFIRHIPRELKWKYQKIRYGYSQDELRSLYVFLGEHIYKCLKAFRDMPKMGYPALLEDGKKRSQKQLEKKWDKILQEMVDGWDFIAHSDEIEDLYIKKYGKNYYKQFAKDYKKNIEKAKLMLDYFACLWD